jgi:hypothetical protein
MYICASCVKNGASFVLKARPDKTLYTGSYCAPIIKGPTKTVTLAQSHQTALKKPAVYSPKVETGQRRDVLRVKIIIEVLSVLARHIFGGGCLQKLK